MKKIIIKFINKVHDFVIELYPNLTKHMKK
jgi:hypothetical protein